MNLQFTTTDWIALACFALAWWGYPWYAELHARSSPSLNALINVYRHQWMREVLSREGRIVDSSILATLSNSATFFSSTTILILGPSGTGKSVLARQIHQASTLKVDHKLFAGETK